MDEYEEISAERVMCRCFLSPTELQIQPTTGAPTTVPLGDIVRVRLLAYGDLASCELTTRTGARHKIALGLILDRAKEAPKFAAYCAFIRRLHQHLATAAPHAEFTTGGFIRLVLVTLGCIGGALLGLWAHRPIFLVLCLVATPIALFTQRPRRYTPLKIPGSSLPA